MLNTIIEKEKYLHQPKIRNDRKQLEQLLAKDFFEIGSSGKLWQREEVIADLLSENNIEISAKNFTAKELTENLVHLIYISETTIKTEIRKAYRSSLWQNNNGQWQLIFHQGTLIK